MLKRTKDEETYHDNQLLLRPPWILFPILLSRPSMKAFSENYDLQDLDLWSETRKEVYRVFGVTEVIRRVEQGDIGVTGCIGGKSGSFDLRVHFRSIEKEVMAPDQDRGGG